MAQITLKLVPDDQSTYFLTYLIPDLLPHSSFGSYVITLAWYSFSFSDFSLNHLCAGMSYFSLCWLRPWHVEVCGPGIELVPLLWPGLLQWQHGILNLLCHKRTPGMLFLYLSIFTSLYLFTYLWFHSISCLLIISRCWLFQSVSFQVKLLWLCLTCLTSLLESGVQALFCLNLTSFSAYSVNIKDLSIVYEAIDDLSMFIHHPNSMHPLTVASIAFFLIDSTSETVTPLLFLDHEKCAPASRQFPLVRSHFPEQSL